MIAPEMLLRAILLQAFYSVRSERQRMQRLEFDPLLRWFVGLGVDEPAWDHSTFSKNRDRLLAGEIAAKFPTAILDRPHVRRLLSSDHFSVGGAYPLTVAAARRCRLMSVSRVSVKTLSRSSSAANGQAPNSYSRSHPPGERRAHSSVRSRQMMAEPTRTAPAGPMRLARPLSI